MRVSQPWKLWLVNLVQLGLIMVPVRHKEPTEVALLFRKCLVLFALFLFIKILNAGLHGMHGNQVLK